jgi:nucleoside-diphosphate-sugar epimerase
MVMRVFVAGGTGVMGRRLVPQLVARGHQVTATTTSPAACAIGEASRSLAAPGIGAKPLMKQTFLDLFARRC